MYWSGVLAMLAAAQAYASPFKSASQKQLCNGHASFCDRKYSNVTWIGTHNSPFDRGGLTGNQQRTVTEQLDAGIRFLQAQALPFTNETMEDGEDTDLKRRSIAPGESELHLCHSWCGILDAGSLTDYLITVKTWLDENPNEVVTLLLTNQEGRPVSEFASAFEKSDLKSYAFSPPADAENNKIDLDSWPTYSALIKAKTRLVVFLDRIEGGNVPYILDEWHYFFETPFTLTSPSQLLTCPINRPPRISTSNGRMYILNHSLNKPSDDLFGAMVPDHDSAPKVNAARGEWSIGAHAEVCVKEFGRKPNVVLVDDFHSGNVFQAQRVLNGL